MTNHNSMRSTARHGEVLSTVIFVLAWTAGSMAASPQQAPPRARIDLDQAIQLALAHNHSHWNRCARRWAQGICHEDSVEALIVVTYDCISSRT